MAESTSRAAPRGRLPCERCTVAEDGYDRYDSDCDDSPAIRRDYVVGFEGLGDFNSIGATVSGGVLTLNAAINGHVH